MRAPAEQTAPLSAATADPGRRPARSPSLRNRFLVVVLAGAIAPLALTGAWLLRTSARAGEALLRTQLNESLTLLTAEMHGSWQRRWGDLLLLAGNEPVRQSLIRGTTLDGAGNDYMESLFTELQHVVHDARITANDGRLLWHGTAPPRTETRNVSAYEPSFLVDIPIRDTDVGGRRIGTMKVSVKLTAILPNNAASLAAVPGATLVIRETSSGAVLRGGDPVALNATRAQLDEGAVNSESERWIVAQRALDDPSLELLAAAPLAPYITPFRHSARVSAIILMFVVALSTLLVIILSSRITRSLADLADAAEQVALGRLETQVPVTSADEVGRLGRSFNAMTARLRDTLAERARRESLAAVGEFAAELAHEIRNGHTSLRLDLQRAHHSLSQESPAQRLVARGLERIARLDQVVTGALRIARSGHVQLAPLDIRVPLTAAMADVQGDVVNRGTTVRMQLNDDTPTSVIGDAAALQQLFVNLLTNAIDAAGASGIVEINVNNEGSVCTVEINDSGPGGAPVDQAFERFVTTKTNGTGLGLPIAKRIAEAHGGAVTISRTNDRTVTKVQLRTPMNG